MCVRVTLKVFRIWQSRSNVEKSGNIQCILHLFDICFIWCRFWETHVTNVMNLMYENFSCIIFYNSHHRLSSHKCYNQIWFLFCTSLTDVPHDSGPAIEITQNNIKGNHFIIEADKGVTCQQIWWYLKFVWVKYKKILSELMHIRKLYARCIPTTCLKLKNINNTT